MVGSVLRRQERQSTPARRIRVPSAIWAYKVSKIDVVRGWREGRDLPEEHEESTTDQSDGNI